MQRIAITSPPHLSCLRARILAVLACCMSCCFVQAQTWRLNIVDDQLKDTLVSTHVGQVEAKNEALNYYYAVLDEGFFSAESDTVVQDSTLLLLVRRNKQYALGNFYLSAPDGTPSSDSRVFGEFSKGRLNQTFGRALSEFENNGFPFATIRIDSLAIRPTKRKQSSIMADVHASFTQGPLIVNDSLYIRSTQPLPYSYISNYIDFKKGRLYNEMHIQQTEKRLRELPFLQVKRRPEVRFSDEHADLFVFVERKKANYFNGVAGLRPDEATGKVNVTGDAEVRLMNAFNRGEEFGLTWRKLQPQTQDLAVRTMLPYLFNTPLALDGRLQIYKRDTSFTSVKLMAGTGVLLPRNQRLRVFIESNRSDQLTRYYTAGSLANAQHTLYGISVQLETLDYRWNPRMGYSLQAEGATGYRTASVLQGETSAAMRKQLTRAEAQLECYLPVFKRQTILFAFKGAAMFSDSLFENEVYRIGGLRTIRGINEESIFATAWGVGTVEYRWLFEENSALYVFVDQAWYEYKSNKGLLHDVPLTAGAGFNFETKAGIFTFNYALGKQFDNPILIRNGKISFGFRSLF